MALCVGFWNNVRQVQSIVDAKIIIWKDQINKVIFALEIKMTRLN